MLHNYRLTFNSLRSDGTEAPYVRTVATDSHAVARAFARSMVGEPVEHGTVLIGVESVHQTEELPAMGRSLMSNLEIWQRVLRDLAIPPERCTPVYSYRIGLPHNLRDPVPRPGDVSREPEIIGFTFRFTHVRHAQGPDGSPWRYYDRPRVEQRPPDEDP